MKINHLPALAPILLLAAIPSIGLAQGSVKIQSPADGATLDALDENRVIYEVKPGPRGDHAHVIVDGKEVAILRELKGSYLLETLSTGKHNLCVSVANKDHVLIGIDQCVRVTVN
jgi:hypothetical protein